MSNFWKQVKKKKQIYPHDLRKAKHLSHSLPISKNGEWVVEAAKFRNAPIEQWQIDKLIKLGYVTDPNKLKDMHFHVANTLIARIGKQQYRDEQEQRMIVKKQQDNQAQTDKSTAPHNAVKRSASEHNNQENAKDNSSWHSIDI